MCEVALLVQHHVTHPVTQCDITWMECQCSWLSLNLDHQGIAPGLEYRTVIKDISECIVACFAV